MSESALQLESRFSLPPNSLGYCGLKTAGAVFQECIKTGKCERVPQEVDHFIVLNPYLNFLHKVTALPKFSYEVIEGYWIGNDILKKAKAKDYFLLLDYFKKQGVPDFLLDELKDRKPENFIPSHLFQVLHVGVGRASGSVPFNIETINNCMVRWGEVKKVTAEKAEIELNSLREKSKGVYELTSILQEVPYSGWLTPGLKMGDIAVVHWNMVIKTFSEEEEEKIMYWTKEVIKSRFNA
ncbi:MAG: DUF6390 family protein [Candidatus Levyibacteriota bacterium]